MNRSNAPTVSAYPRATPSRIVLRAGTYVTGMPWPIASSVRSFGTAMSAVSAEPPMARRSSRTVRWSATPSARATSAARSSSTRCRWP